MDLERLSDEALAEWREHPVTRLLRDGLAVQAEALRSSATAAYWSGRAWPEADRLSVLRLEAFREDLFEASADEVKAALRWRDDEVKDGK